MIAIILIFKLDIYIYIYIAPKWDNALNPIVLVSNNIIPNIYYQNNILANPINYLFT